MSREDHAKLAEALSTSNPFHGTRVSEPNDVGADVDAIHKRPFRKILRAVSTVKDGNCAIGVMLQGPAGIGKSHLLARLHRWAKEQRAVDYVYLHNLQASAQRMPRYLLKATVNGLFAYRRGSYSTAILYAWLLDVLPPDAEAISPPELVRRMSGDNSVDLAIYGVLIAFMDAMHASDHCPAKRSIADAAVEWLSGEEIDAEIAAELSSISGRRIPPCLRDNYEIERVLIVFAGLLGSMGRSLVLCLDQIDNLDVDQVKALAAFLHSLMDHAKNILVITSGVASTMQGLRESGAIPEAAWDRLAEEEIFLHEIPKDEAKALVSARVGSFWEPFKELPELAILQEQDPLFPLSEEWWQQCTGDILQLRPRQVLGWAKLAWEEQLDRLQDEEFDAWLLGWKQEGRTLVGSSTQTAPPREADVDQHVATKLQELVERRKASRAGLPPDADNIATLARILLHECKGKPGYSLVDLEVPSTSRPKNFDLLVSERAPSGALATTKMLALTARHGNSVTAALRRLLEDKANQHKVLVVTDERRKLPMGAKGKKYLETLHGTGRLEQLQLQFDAYAQLDALVTLMRQARVGDFEVPQGRGFLQISEQEVAGSYHRLDRFRQHPLLRHFLIEEDARDASCSKVLKLLDVRVGLCGLLSWRTGAGVREIVRKLSADHGVTEEVLLPKVMAVVDDLRKEGVISATDADDDCFLWWLGVAS